jgi:hypothetical protein
MPPGIRSKSVSFEAGGAMKSAVLYFGVGVE